MADLPELLTVEEAARYLRIGRTKAYALTRQWRDSGGCCGLPVVDIGNVLRVPRRRLEQLVATAATGSDLSEQAGDSTSAETTTSASPRDHQAPSTPTKAAPGAQRRHARPTSQLDLFPVSPASTSAGH